MKWLRGCSMKSFSKKEKTYKLIKNIFYIVLSVYLLLVIWQIFSLLVSNPLLLPSVSQTMQDLFQTLYSIDFYSSFGMTLFRTLYSFMFAIFIAVVLYLLSKTCEFCQKFCSILVSILRSFPTIAIILFLLIWINSQIAPSIISILVVMPIIYAGLQGLNVDRNIKIIAKLYDIKGRNYIKFIWLPNFQKNLIPLFASTIALNLKVMVASEVLAHTYNSLGGLMQSASVYFEIGQLIALAFITILTAIILEKLTTLLKYVRFKVK